MKLLILARYDSLGSSSRYRIYQYIPHLQKKGWDVKVQFLLSNKYIEHIYYKKPLPFFEIIKNYFVRIFCLLNKRKYDAIWLQQEAFPWFPEWFEKMFLKSRVPIINDHDDAFFHRYDLNNSTTVRFLLGHKIDRVMNLSNLVIVGNQYLAERAEKSLAHRIEILPTVVDTQRYKIKQEHSSQKFTVGWIGSPNNSKYIYQIKKVFQSICNDEQTKLVLVGSGKIFIEDCNMEIIDWSESTEVENILSFDVGIMPLPDNPWERGKCGFKLIQYMACGLPVIASPVGINREIIEHGVNGFIATSDEEWLHYLTTLRKNPNLRKEMGAKGRLYVENKYSLQIAAPLLLKLFDEMVA